MKNIDFEALRELLLKNNSTEILLKFNSVLKDIVENVMQGEAINLDLRFLIESTNRLKNLTNSTEEVYDEIIKKDLDNKVAYDKMNSMEEEYVNYTQFIDMIKNQPNNKN